MGADESDPLVELIHRIDRLEDGMNCRMELEVTKLTGALDLTEQKLRGDYESRLRYFGVVNILLVLFGVAGGAALWGRLVARAEGQIDRAYRESSAIASAVGQNDRAAIEEFRTVFNGDPSRSSELFLAAYLDVARRSSGDWDTARILGFLSKDDAEMSRLRSPALAISVAEAILWDRSRKADDYRLAARVANRVTSAGVDNEQQVAAALLSLTAMITAGEDGKAVEQHRDYLSRPFAIYLKNAMKPDATRPLYLEVKAISERLQVRGKLEAVLNEH